MNMAKLSNQCKEHLESALEMQDPSEKDFHIRQVLQAGGFEKISDEPTTQ